MNRTYVNAGSYRIQTGGPDRSRTCDPLNANQVLSQLSYRPTLFGLPVSTERP